MLFSVALAAFMGAGSALATKCDLNNKCPKDSPCCSQYGECGVGAFCLGGCDPRMSYSLDACVPAPVCEDKTMKLDSLDKIQNISTYLGDPSKADWVSQGEAVPYKGSLLLTMPQDSVGTVLASTEYMWYGNVKARLKTSRGRGVVTAFILLSDVKDEIDYEFVGVDLETAQTNFYWQAVPNYENSGNITLSDTFNNFHDYEIQWTPDSIKWLVDGQVGRTVHRKDTFNKTTHQFEYPQTPARVQLSIWPGGSPKNAQGTIDWAGGEIEWDTPDIENVGYYYTTFQEVSIECYQTDSPPGTNSKTSYIYDNESGTNDTVIDSDKDTVLASFEGSGLDMDAGKPSGDKTKTGSSPQNTAAQVPGGGNGSTGQDHDDDGGDSDSGSSDSGDSGSDSSGSGGAPADVSNCDPSDFNQDCNGNSDDDDGGSGGGSGGSGGTGGSGKSSASVLAIVIAGAALYWL